MRCFLRARRPEEKEVRREAILKAARELALETGPIALGLNELARRAGVSKPNVYRYFEGREEVLLRLLVLELADAAEELERRLGPRCDLSRVLVEAFLARPLLCQLLGMAASILEHNLSAEAIASAKTDLHAHVGRIAAALVRARPKLTSADASWAVTTLGLYVAGLWPAAHPSKTAAEVLARPEFAALSPDARRDLTRFVRVLFAGLSALE